MTEQKRDRRAIIEYQVVKPFVDATALGLAVGGPAAFSGNFAAGFVAGSSFSLLWFWKNNNFGSKRKNPSRPDYIATNWGSGKMRRFEQVMPGHITRETYAGAIWRLLKPSRPIVINQPPVNPARPAVLDQYKFMSFDNAGNPVQLLGCDVHKFLRRAWYKRDKGKGLGRRFWDNRERNAWPDWYPGPYWYEAVMRLLAATQKGLNIQLVDILGHQHIGLRYDDHATYGMIVWWYYQNEKRSE